MKRGKSTGKPTKDEQARLDKVHSMACICCELAGVAGLQPSKTEAHHLVDGGDRAKSGGHSATLPLCGWHHRAACGPYERPSQMLCGFGPSLKHQGGKGKFVERWGTERELLAMVNERLGVE